MKSILAAAALALLPAAALAAAPPMPAVQHFPAGGGAPSAAPGTGPAFSAAVMAGDTLYVSGVLDVDPATGKAPTDAKDGARRALDSIKKAIEGAGLTMDDLVWVQIFTTDLGYYADFNAVYRTYFKGPLPARAFLGAGSLLNGAHFEVMGVAVKSR